MFSPQLRYFLYGTIISASLISVSVQAGTNDGVFGDYFTRIIGSCPSNTVVTGFDSTASTYGTRRCSSLQALLGTLFGSSIAPDWQAMIGFNPDGTLKYGTVAGWDNTVIGTISSFNLSRCPSGWSLADGTSGTPDLRGEFIRGLDNGRGVDTGRILATNQIGSPIVSTVNIVNQGWPGTHNADEHFYDIYWDTNFDEKTYHGTTGSIPVAGSLYDSRGTAVQWSYGRARPRNVALLYCMKIADTTIPVTTTPVVTTSGGSKILHLLTNAINNTSIGPVPVSSDKVLSNTLLPSSPTSTAITIMEAGTYMLSATLNKCVSGANNYSSLHLYKNSTFLVGVSNGAAECQGVSTTAAVTAVPWDVLSARYLDNAGQDIYGSFTVVKLP